MSFPSEDDDDTLPPPDGSGVGVASFADEYPDDVTRVADLGGLARQGELNHHMGAAKSEIEGMPEESTRLADIAGLTPFGADDDDVPTMVSDTYPVGRGPRGPTPPVKPEWAPPMTPMPPAPTVSYRPSPVPHTPAPMVAPHAAPMPQTVAFDAPSPGAARVVSKSFPPPRDVLPPSQAPAPMPVAAPQAAVAPSSGGSTWKIVVLALLLGMMVGGGVIAFLVLNQ